MSANGATQTMLCVIELQVLASARVALPIKFCLAKLQAVAFPPAQLGSLHVAPGDKLHPSKTCDLHTHSVTSASAAEQLRLLQVPRCFLAR